MTQSPVCIRCGKQHLFMRAYRGSYCRDCHGSQAAKPRSEETPRPHPQRSHTTSSARRRKDDEQSPDLEPPCDET